MMAAGAPVDGGAVARPIAIAMTRPALADLAYLDHCARAVTQLLRTRTSALPRFVAAGSIDQAAADRSIALAEATDRQWRWVLDATRPPLPIWDERTGYFGAYCFELAVDLAGAGARQRAVAARSGDDRAQQLADAYVALAWWQQPPTGAPKSGDCRIVIHAACGRQREGRAP